MFVKGSVLIIGLFYLPWVLGWGESVFNVFGYETCTETWITANDTELRLLLREHVFGQPLVEDTVASALKGHFGSSEPRKALTLSFHGWPGSGKNYVANFLARALYVMGTKSQFYKYFNARIDFPLETQTTFYQEKLRNEVTKALEACPRSLFIFDEVDMMPYKVLDALHSFFGYQDKVGDVIARQAIFIFLSNRGGTDISEKMVEFWKQNKRREELRIADFKDILTRVAFNEKGGLQHGDIINSHLITYFVPFLPLERSHVLQCIHIELARRGATKSKEVIDDVMSQISFSSKTSPSAGLFATSGCKNVDTLVATSLEAARFRLTRRNSNPEL